MGPGEYIIDIERVQHSYVRVFAANIDDAIRKAAAEVKEGGDRIYDEEFFVIGAATVQEVYKQL